MDSRERGLDPIAMNITNPRKECWPSRESNLLPPVLKSGAVLIELWGSITNEPGSGKRGLNASQYSIASGTTSPYVSMNSNLLNNHVKVRPVK